MRGYQVHLRGVVTCNDPSTGRERAAVFVHDATGSIYVVLPEAQKYDFKQGTMVEVQGHTFPGSAAPMVIADKILALGTGPLPESPAVEDLLHLQTGGEDGKWVQVEGTIRSVLIHERNGVGNFKYVTLQLAMVGATIGVSMLWEPAVDYDGLIDAKVRVRGNAAPLFNRNDQIIGARLMTAGISTLEVLEAAPSDPFLQPRVPIGTLLHWNLLSTAHHRVHLRGYVTLQWPGSLLCIRDASRGICAQTAEDTGLTPGDVADVVGFAEPQNGTAVLSDATFKLVSHGTPLSSTAVTAEEALLGKEDSDLVAVDGQLLSSEVTATGTNLLLSSGNFIFAAILPSSTAPGVGGTFAGTWKPGSWLRLTGICSVRLDTQSNLVAEGVAEAKSFRLLLRSPADVVVLQQPSWWTPGHAVLLLSLLALVVAGAVGWITHLRRRVHSQMADLKRAREESAAIEELARAMDEVTAQRRLTARASVSGSHQLAQLGLCFNKMLAELEAGDQATRRAEEKLQRLALTDELTGLPNRRSLTDRLEQSLALAKRENRTLAVLFIDLDGFKAVNDALGHAVGDLLLVEVCLRLQTLLRQSDTLARLGGDEFTVVLNSIHAPKEAQMVAESLVEVLAQPFLLDGHDAVVGASIGISVFPIDGRDAGTLLKQADSAMYAAKENGKNQARGFTPDLGSSASERVSIESQLRGALGRNEIHLDYQPSFDLATHRMTRFEALARWTHPTLGVVPPGKFIPLAEESGQILSLGAYVLRRACIQAASWQGTVAYPVQVAVNVSSRQFARESFVYEVSQILEETGLKPELLQLELTESIMLTGTEEAARKMRRLRALGVSLAIDDFGTGYSCLSYLPELPFDTLKVDRSFVQKLGTNSGADALVKFLIMLAHSLNMQVVIEGVETAEQLRRIEQLNGNEIQGYLLGRPTADPQSLLAGNETLVYSMDLMGRSA